MKIEKLDIGKDIYTDYIQFLVDKINEIIEHINTLEIIEEERHLNTEQPSQEYGYVQALRLEIYAYLNNGDPLQKIEQWKMRNGVMDIFEKYREKNEPAPLSHDKGLEEIQKVVAITLAENGHPLNDGTATKIAKAILSHLEKKA
jgi:hypothetical protein